jgi:protocatechuate 3,4-dioxygenase beta subunit
MRTLLPLLLVLSLVGCDPQSPPKATAPITVALCGPDEPGKKLVFHGRILDYQGRPLAKSAIIAWGADQRGLYVEKGAKSRVPRLRGTAVTDEGGRYRFSTIWPGAYPDASQPAHIHLGVMAHEHRVRYVTFWFEGDPSLLEKHRKNAVKDPEVRIVKPVQGRDGVWRFEFDIRLEEA